MSEVIEIKSHTGIYKVEFEKDLRFLIQLLQNNENYFVVDDRVLELYSSEFSVLKADRTVRFKATEENKDLEKISGYIHELTEKGFKRNHRLVAIGGGITQDVTCFISSIIYRGVEWEFVPTTLLAQADSCIGSKSSINCSGIKNLVGNFYPPKKISLCLEFLRTLSPADVKSGIAEIVKVFMVKGLKEAKEISENISKLSDFKNLESFLKRGLQYKKEVIEIDEFDRGIRNIMNYGHTFGHAIEKATDYRIPHGIAVAIGMDMANLYSKRFGFSDADAHRAMHQGLFLLYSEKKSEKIDLDSFFDAIQKDKKNTTGKLNLILPIGKSATLQKTPIIFDQTFKDFCFEYFKSLRTIEELD